MKKILLAIILLFAVSNVYAGEHFYVDRMYTKDIMSLGMACEAIFDKDNNTLKFLHQTEMLKLIDGGGRLEIREVVYIPKEEAFIDLPTDMVEFKLMNDYRTYYTLDKFVTRILK